MFQVLPLAQVMVAKSEQLLTGLKSSKKEDRVTALKQVKNQIIGNKHKKQALSALLPEVIELLANAKDDPDIAVNSAVVLGSFSYGAAGSSTVQQILAHPQGLPSVLHVLVQSEDAHVLDAVVRCLKVMCQAGQVPTQPLLQPPVLPKLVQLLCSTKSQQPQQRPSTALAEATAAVLAKCCQTSEERVVLTEAGVVQAAASLLSQAQHQSGQLQALELLAALITPANTAACEQLIQQPNAIDLLSDQLRSNSHAARLLAATCIAHLAVAISQYQVTPGEDGRSAGASSSSGRPGRQGSGKSSSGQASRSGPARAALGSYSLESAALQSTMPIRPPVAGGPTGTTAATSAVPSQAGCWHLPSSSSVAAHDVYTSASAATAGTVRISEDFFQKLVAARRAALPVVLRLLSDSTVGVLAPATLAVLIEDSDELQQAAVDADAVRQLCALLNQQQPAAATTDAGLEQQLRMREGCLRSLGYLCMARDDARNALLDAKVLPQVQAALEEPRSPGARAAAALSVMAISRDPKVLKCALIPPEIAKTLCQLLTDPHLRVQVNATAAVCNLGLEFSTIKQVMMEQPGVLDTLATNAVSPVSMLRMYSTWALRNFAHKSSLSFKQAIMQALGWPCMRSLLHDSDEAVQEQAVCMLRNMCMDAPDHITAALQWGGGELLAVLEEKLDPSSSVPTQLRIHSLYTIVNTLTGDEVTKEQVMSSNLPALIMHHLRSTTDSEVRLAAVWCLINLTWTTAPTAGTATDNSTNASTGAASASDSIQLATDNATPSRGSAVEGAREGSPGRPHSRGLEGRLRRLRALGAPESLQALLADPSLEVRHRARAALEQMRAGTAG